MERLIFILFIITSLPISGIFSQMNCADFDGSDVTTTGTPSTVLESDIDNWNSFIVDVFQQRNDSNGADGSNYLYAEDGNGPSFIYNENVFVGDLSCSSICFDYKVFSDGVVAVSDIPPSIYIYSGSSPFINNLIAKWEADFTVTESSDWVNVCAHIRSDIIPEGWQMLDEDNNTLEDWQTLISDISGIAFTVDVGPGSQHLEEIGIDNICVTEHNFAEPIFHTENLLGSVETDFCVGEDIIIDGSASNYDLWHQVVVNRILPDGSPAWFYNTPKIWEPAGPSLNITQWMEDNNPPKFFDVGEYQIVFVVGNYCDAWVADELNITIHDLNEPLFVIEDICRVRNYVEVTVNGVNENPNHLILVHEIPDGEPCEIASMVSPPVNASTNLGATNNWTFELPYEPGKCYVVRFMVNSEYCGWEETQQLIEIPDVPPVYANFSVDELVIANSEYYLAYFESTFNTTIPLIHDWTIEISTGDESGPWVPFTGFSVGMTTDSPLALLNSNNYYRVIHRIGSDTDEFCSEDTRVHIYGPYSKQQNGIIVYSEDGSMMDFITFPNDGREENVSNDSQAMTDGDGRKRIMQKEIEIKLFPNPAKEDIYLQFNNMNNGMVDLQIIDVMGSIQFVQELNVNSNEAIHIPIHNLSDGIYFLQLRFEDGTTHAEKFMIRN